MDPVVADKRLTRYKAELDAVKKILEDKSRELFLANQEEQKANAYLQNIIRSMQSCLIVTDAQCTIQVVNQATLELLGYELQDIEGKSLSILNVEGDSIDLTNIEALSSIDTLVRQEVKYRAKNGEKVPVLFSSSAMYDAEDQLNGIVCVALDLSTYKMLENQLLQSEKMASIGQLAAGVAHEINNPMGFIFSNLGTLSEYVEDILVLLETYKSLEESVAKSDLENAQAQLTKLKQTKKELDLGYLLGDIKELIEESHEGANRVRKIVLNLKEFSHSGQSDKTLANINAGLDSTINIVWNELKYKVTLDKDYGDIPEVLCHAQEINQVFMNLLVNAGHAIKEQGEIKIRTYEEENYICVSIADSGEGMPPDVQRRIFEPFFTTKKIGEGTGLGLSMSYQIVADKHGGELQVESEIDVGTVFIMKLPKVSNEI